MDDKSGKSSQAKRVTIMPPLSSTTVASVLVATDSLTLLGSGYFTYDRVIVYSLDQNLYIVAIVFIWLVTLTLINFAGLYRYEAASHPARHVPVILVAMATAFLFFLAAAFSLKISENFSRLWLVIFIGGGAASLTLVRLLISFAMVKLLHHQRSKRNIAVVGTGEQCRRFITLVSRDPIRPLSIQGVYSDSPNPNRAPSEGEFTSEIKAMSLDQLMFQARGGLIDDVVIALPWSQDNRIMAIIAKLRELPVHVYLVSDLIGFRTDMNSPPSHFGSLPVLKVVGKPIAGWDAILKLSEDYLLALVLVTVISPLLLLIAIAIKLDSRGPIIFRQKRLGFNNQIFDIYKFRSMRMEEEIAPHTIQASRGDPRVTPLGAIMRRWSLDELPQIFNVLNGSMSLVGPRPHALDHNEEFSGRMKDYFSRHRIKPGITGLAQVRGFRGSTETQDLLEGRVNSDIFYAENWSLGLDFWIMVRTALVLVSGKNAY